MVTSQSVKVTVLYFGLIAEAVEKDSELLKIESGITISHFKEKLISEYNTLKNLNYQIALNKEIVTDDSIIFSESEIAILPPFAGG